MGEVEEILYVHILNQSLIDNTIMISNAGLADTYQIPLAEVTRTMEGLIRGGYLIKLREGYYSVLFGHLDDIRA